MNDPILIRKYDVVPPVDFREAVRYMGDRDPSDEVMTRLRESADECKDVFTYQVCARDYPVSFTGTGVDLGFASVACKSFADHLAGCSRVTVFAATVGIGIDRLIRRYARLSPSRALCLQALGTERIEALCDLFESEIRQTEARNGNAIRPRFSPGYGDLPLSLQTDIFRILDCPRSIGLSLNRSLLMSPSKSVTAIIGITEGSNQ